MAKIRKLSDGKDGFFPDSATEEEIAKKIKDYEQSLKQRPSLVPNQQYMSNDQLPTIVTGGLTSEQQQQNLEQSEKSGFPFPVNMNNPNRVPPNQTPDFVTLNPFRNNEGIGFTNLPVSDQAKLSAGLMFSVDDEQRMSLIKNVFGDNVRFQNTDQGVLAKFTNPKTGKSQTTYINGPGFSAQDFSSLFGTAAFMAPFMKWAQGANVLGSVGRQAAIGAGTSVIQDSLVKGLGADTEIDLNRAAMSALVGGAFGVGTGLGEKIIAAQAKLKAAGVPPTMQNILMLPEMKGWIADFWKRYAPTFGSSSKTGAIKTLDDISKAVDDIAKAEGNSMPKNQLGEIMQQGLKDQQNAKSMFGDVPSWQARAEALYKKVGIPPETMISIPQTQKVLQEILQNPNIDPRIVEMTTNPALQKIFDTVKINKGQLTYESLRMLRKDLGSLLRTDVAAQQVKNDKISTLYWALTQDAKAGATSLGKGAEFAAADAFYSEGQKLFNGTLMKITKAKNGEEAFLNLENALYGDKPNIGMLQAAQKMLPPAIWNDFRATVISRMGKLPGNALFSATEYVKNFSAMSDEVKTLLIGEGKTRSLLEELSSLMHSHERYAKGTMPLDRLASGANKFDIGVQIGAPGYLLLDYDMVIAGLGAGGGWALGKAMNSPKTLEFILAIAKSNAEVGKVLATSAVRNSPIANPNEEQKIINFIQSSQQPTSRTQDINALRVPQFP